MSGEHLTELPSLNEVRRLVMADALAKTFKDGRLDPAGSIARVSSRRELMYAALAAYEFADADGAFSGDRRALEAAVNCLESNYQKCCPNGTFAKGDANSGYFGLVPFTRALLSVKPHVDEALHTRLVDGCVQLFANAADKLNRTHDYCNIRALEAVGCLGLHRLTDEQQYLDRCNECLDELITRQYPCGAQPYHTGSWIWGRRPAHVYQLLSGSMMLYLGFELQRDDAVQYVRRVIKHSMLATNRRGEAFVATFEGLHKARTLQCIGRQWAISAALGDEELRGLTRAAYGHWASAVVDFQPSPQRQYKLRKMEAFPLEALTEALHMGVRDLPPAETFVPKPGLHGLDDISTIIVHEPKLDVCMSLLSGYSAFAEADCGDVKLFAVTPELSDEPTFSCAGTDSLRAYWQKPSEQIDCAARGAKTILSGLVYTKWDKVGIKDFRLLHNRRLGVTMTYAGGELLLEFETLKKWHPEPVSTRLLFLLIGRPFTASPHLRIGGEIDADIPPAISDQTFCEKAALGAVRFSAPDGSAIEIVPELSTAQFVTAERPPDVARAGSSRPEKHGRIKPANEGSLRVAFEGPNALDRGRYRIRFLPG